MPAGNPTDRLVESIAQVAHEANRAYCRTIGDDSQPSWHDAPDWQKESAIAGVRAIADDDVRAPAESHESWFDQKLEDGWTWGPEKDPDLKTHPCMVPYHDLPPEQRTKDALFFAVVNALLGRRLTP